MMEVEFDVTNMEGWINDIASKYHTSVIINNCIPWKKTGGQALVEINEEGKQLIEDLRRHGDLLSVDLEKKEDGMLRGTVSMNNCAIIRYIQSSGCFMERAVAEGDGRVRFTVLAGSSGSIPGLIRTLQDHGLLIDIKRMAPLNDERTITKRQKELVRIALEMGYFDIPKRISLKELASRCGLTQATLGEILKRAQRNILFDYFGKFD